jgi:hypothetical protein
VQADLVSHACDVPYHFRVIFCQLPDDKEDRMGLVSFEMVKD